jgi:glutaredoxin
MPDIIYSQTNCPACEKLKAEYRSKNIPYEEIVIGRDVTVETFRMNYPNVRSVPFVVPDDI